VWRQTDEQYTSANFLSPDEHLHQDIYVAYGASHWALITTTHGTFFVIHPPSSSFATLSTDTHHIFVRPTEDFHIKTTAKNMYRFRQHFESTSTNCTTLRTITVNHLQYRYYDNTLRYVTTHLSQRTSYNITTLCPLQRTGILFSSQIPTHVHILPLQYPTEIVIKNVQLPNH